MGITRRTFVKETAATGLILMTGGFSSAFAADEESIQLLPPQVEGGKFLMQVLKARKSVRAFGPEKLPPQVYSNLLWAATGINRADGKRTSPTGWNKQEMDVYVATDEGLFLYEPKPHGLKRILKDDIRAITGTQPYVKTAPFNLIYVADFSRMAMPTKSFPTLADEEEKTFLSAAASGCIAQNVYLYCTSEGLVTTVRSLIDRPVLAKAMNLRADQRITLAQAVGYPKK